jgi:RNA polymerase sigma-70 factor (ECF subfamily)
MQNKQNFLPQWERFFILYRPYLLSFGFRMTGSLTESEDIVQDTFMACLETDPGTVINHKAWLTKICSNKALDYFKQAYKKREAYPGVWLPDAVPESFQLWKSIEDAESPDENLLRSESLSTSFLLLLQKLTPEERVIYLLSDIFDYSFKEIATFLQKSEEAVKKTAQRARKSFDNQKRFVGFSKDSEALISKFFESAKRGDVDLIESLLSSDSEFWSDGGGKVPAASKAVIKDNHRTARFFAGIWSSKFFNSGAIREEIKLINSRAGLVVSRLTESGEWVFDSLMTFEIEDGKIARIYSQRNPDKLEPLGRMK